MPHSSRRLSLTLTLAIIALMTFALGRSVQAIDLYWDVNGATTGLGGTGNWNLTASNKVWNDSTGTGTAVAWTDANNAVFAGTAGTVSLLANVAPVVSSFQVTGYTLAPSAATRTLGGSISLSTGVNLNMLDTTTSDRAFSIGSVSGGAGSSLTLQGGQTTTGNNARLLLSQANTSINVPTAISGGGTTLAGFVATSTGTGITGTISNSSTLTTLLGATSGNDLTLSSTAAIGGSAGLLISVTNSSVNVGTVTLNAASTYLGGTTLNGGTLVLGNDTALGTNTLTLSTSSTSVLQAGTAARTLANNVVWGGNGTLSGSNAFTFNGTFTSSGAIGRSITVSNTGGLTQNGNVFLAATNVAGGLTVNGTTDATITGVITNNSGANSVASNLTKSGVNTLTLTNSNTYTGTTQVSNGNLIINGNQSGATGPVSTVAAGTGTLGGIGTIGGATTINSGGAITGATNGTTGTLNFNNVGVAIGGNGTYLVDIGGLLSDKLNLGSGVLDLSATGDIISFSQLSTLTGTSYTLATYSSATSTFDTVTNLPTGYSLVYNPTELDLVITAVPEPSTWIGGALVAASLLATQRKRFVRKTARA
jgi:autotransporter-associated beta strand protein